MIQLWHFSLAPGCSVQSYNNQMVGRIFKITPKMSQQACHSSLMHTHNAMTLLLHPQICYTQHAFAHVPGPPNKGIGEPSHNYSYVSLNL